MCKFWLYDKLRVDSNVDSTISSLHVLEFLLVRTGRRQVAEHFVEVRLEAGGDGLLDLEDAEEGGAVLVVRESVVEDAVGLVHPEADELDALGAHALRRHQQAAEHHAREVAQVEDVVLYEIRTLVGTL